MNRVLLLAFLSLLLFAGSVSAKERRLMGQILVQTDNNEKLPAKKNTEVVIIEIGSSEYTDTNGVFSYLLRDADKANKAINFVVNVYEHVIQDPLDGQTRIPKDNELENLFRILVVKKGSPALLSKGRFEKSVEEANVKAREQVSPGKQDQYPPVTLSFAEAASKLGFTADEYREWIRRTAVELEKKKDPQALARAAAANGEFERAGDLSMQATERQAELMRPRPKHQHGPSIGNRRAVPRLIKEASPQSLDDLEDIAFELVKGFRFAGDSYYNGYKFEKALAAYKRALLYVDRKESAELWAAIQEDLGSSYWAIGIRTEGSAIHYHLGEAVKAYQEAQKVFTKNEFPTAWAALQDKLGTVLADQGTRVGGDGGPPLLAEAIAAYHDALTVRTKEQLPQDWATTQHNLGAVFQRQGTRASGEEGRQLLDQAVAAYRNALTVRTKERFPRDWAATQNNLGAVFFEQGIRFDDTHDLVKSAAAYNQALTVYTKQDLPQEWAKIQNNLGIVLQEQGRATRGDAGTNLLAEAAAAYRAALTIRTKVALPQDWAATQNNLGGVLADQGVRTGGDAGLHLLAESVAGYNQALTVYTKQDLPQYWAKIQNNLGLVLFDQGDRIGGEGGKKFIREAIAAYRLALQVRTKETSPGEWEDTTENLQKAEEKLEEMK
jgi:tetratricopeptide (TPR) repeat protein